MSEKYTFWCGWDVSDEIPLRNMKRKWPVGMRGWCTGYGDCYKTYTGHIDAPTADEAERIIRSCYGAFADHIVMRWDPIEHEYGWRPASDRFPEAKP